MRWHRNHRSIDHFLAVSARSIQSRSSSLSLTHSSINTQSGKAAHFRVRISCATPQGLKAIARKGQTAQEVFFTVRLSDDIQGRWMCGR